MINSTQITKIKIIKKKIQLSKRYSKTSKLSSLYKAYCNAFLPSLVSNIQLSLIINNLFDIH
jgi:hypothetical protein